MLTSRTQHFRDDGQIRGALLDTTRAGRDATRIVALEDFSDTQIRDFLTRLYGGDADRRPSAGSTGSSEIKDLLGLSRNPRMLAFIAELPDSRLDEAERSGQTHPGGGPVPEDPRPLARRGGQAPAGRLRHQPLPEEHRLAACRDLALRSVGLARFRDEAVSAEDLVRDHPGRPWPSWSASGSAPSRPGTPSGRAPC